MALEKLSIGLALVSLVIASACLLTLTSLNLTTSVEIDSLKEQINGLQTQIDIEKAFALFKKELASPGEYIAELIVNEIVSELEASNNEFQQWLTLVGESVVKQVLASLINAKMPALVWNNVQATSLGNREYNVSVVTYFPIDIPTGVPIIGTITIAKIALTLSATVDVVYESVTNISIASLEMLA